MDNLPDPLRLENQLCFPLYACARKIVNLYTPFFKPLGITYTQYIVFMVLWARDGLSVRELGERLYLDSGTLTPLLKKMQAAGYVRRVRSEEDERITRVFLTDAGRAMREKCREIPLQLSRSVDFTPDEARTLYDLLYRFLDSEPVCDMEGKP
jgi:DNA-binding MarR family transcriptional regulator